MAFFVEQKRSLPQLNEIPPRSSAPSHRHAAPCGPWPWMELDDSIELSSSKTSATPFQCPHEAGKCKGCWAGYPQSIFPNWTPDQVARSKMKSIPSGSDKCVIYRVDVRDDGNFSDPGSHIVNEEGEYWKLMQESKRSEDVRVRALFVDNISVPVLQMLGTKYKVEPFFWTSSVNWIPSRYQEDLQVGKGDHITITLAFPRIMKRDPTYHQSTSHVAINEVIDTQSPLPLRSSGRPSDHMVILDLLAVHMIRSTDSSTIISYQPTSDRQVTSASSVHSRVYLAGQSIYWNKIFQKSKDPTFVLLTVLWYALYAWDQALEMLWEHICQLELNVINASNIEFTQELHRVRAHLLHYTSLLDDFRKSVKFVLETPNPAMDSPENESEREFSRTLLEKEGKNLLIQIERLSNSRTLWDKRLTNVMHLAFSSVNIEDSKHMQRLTEAAVRDSAAMKQVAYLTMVFLPASFVATAFGMNVQEINPGSHGTLAHYAETAIPLTLFTMWLVVALQGKWYQRDANGNDQPASLLTRFSWPVLYLQRWTAKRKRVREQIMEKNVNDAV